MSISFQVRDGVGVVVVTGALTSAGVDSFREQFVSWWQGVPGVRNVIVDLTNVDFLDSSGLGSLIALLKRISDRGGDMKIVGLQKKVRMIFEITRAYKIFDIFDNTDEAIKACG